MGISIQLHNEVEKYIFNDINMIELGNQYFYVNGIQKDLCKPYFEQMGIKHISIDINGKDGVLKLNLCNSINLKPVDIVTNFGTSEHVKNQYMCFKNIHGFCKLGGLIMHEVPEEGSFLKHGLYWYIHNFFINIYANQKIIELKNLKYPDGNLIFCIIKKTSEEFVSESWFNDHSNK